MSTEDNAPVFHVEVPSILQSINKPTVNGDIVRTLVTLSFKKLRDGIEINIPHKNKQLLQSLKDTNSNVNFVDNIETQHSILEKMTYGIEYSNLFHMDSNYLKEGYIYVICKITSIKHVNKFKHGEKNIMNLLKQK